MKWQAIIVAFAIAAATPARAAEQTPICATRPGKTTAPCTVPAGKFQIETGLVDWSVQKDSGNRDTALVIGETTFKYGLSDRSDIEVDVTPWQRLTSRGPGGSATAKGFGDITVGYKQLLTADGAAMQIALLPVVKIPTAGHSLGNGKWDGGLLVPIQYSIPHSALTIGLTPEMDWVADSDGSGHHAAMVQVVSLGWQATDKLNLSADLWGQWDWDPAGKTREASLDVSAAYLVNANVQLDWGADFGLNRSTPGVELYTGVSVRF